MKEHYDSYRYENSVTENTGTRWASDEEIKESLTRVNLLADRYPACGLPLISDGRTAYVNNTDSHSLIIGSTGSKKSRLFVMPMLEMIARAGESVVCTDPKGELFERTSGLFQREGYTIQVLNLRDTRYSHGWNPLKYAVKYYAMNELDMAASLISDLSYSIFADRPNGSEDPFWNQKSRSLFQGVCHMLMERKFFSEEQVTMRSVLQLTSKIDYSGRENSIRADTTNDLVSEYPEDSLARLNMESALLASEKTLMNIEASFSAEMQIFQSRKSLVDLLSTDEIAFEKLGNSKSILYIIMQDEKTTLHSLVSLAIKQCYEILIDEAQHSKGLKLRNRVNFLLDEFSNLPAIPDMSSMISAARSRNIRFFIVVQSMQQLVSKYREDAQTLKGNCTDWVYLTSRELSLLEELKNLCGNDSRTNLPLISVSQLQRLSKEAGEALVLCGRMYPYLTHLADIERYPFAHIESMKLPCLKVEPAQPIVISKLLRDKVSARMKRNEDLLDKF